MGVFSLQEVAVNTRDKFPNRISRAAEKVHRIGNYTKEPDPENSTEGKAWTKYKVGVKPNKRKVRNAGIARLVGPNIEEAHDMILSVEEPSMGCRNWKFTLGRSGIWMSAKKAFVPVYRASEKNETAGLTGQILNDEDYNALMQEIHADFLFRCAWVYNKYGHLYSTLSEATNRAPDKTNPGYEMFFPTHAWNMLSMLIDIGEIKCLKELNNG